MESAIREIPRMPGGGGGNKRYCGISVYGGEWSAKVHANRQHCPKCKNAFNTHTRACTAFLVLPFGRGLHKSRVHLTHTEKERAIHYVEIKEKRSGNLREMPANYNNEFTEFGL